jgi:RNA 3'-terminal phosphate cyclase
MQVALPCMLFAPAPTVVTFKGGTDVTASPPLDFFRFVLAPQLRALLHIEVDCNVQTRGFYPKGGGVVRHVSDEAIIAPKIQNMLIIAHFSTCATNFCGSNIRDTFTMFIEKVENLVSTPIFPAYFSLI